MTFFGLSRYGIGDYIKYAVRDDYKEPEKPLNVLEAIRTGAKLKKPIFDLLRELDFDIGTMDGYSYRSKSRLDLQRNIGLIKPDGPTDMFKFPLTTSMDYGWWIEDPELKGERWWLPKERYGKARSDYVRYTDDALKTDAFFLHTSG